MAVFFTVLETFFIMHLPLVRACCVYSVWEPGQTKELPYKESMLVPSPTLALERSLTIFYREECWQCEWWHRYGDLSVSLKDMCSISHHSRIEKLSTAAGSTGVFSGKESREGYRLLWPALDHLPVWYQSCHLLFKQQANMYMCIGG